MRHVFLPVLLLIAILVFCISSALFISCTIDQADSYLKNAVQSYENGDLRLTAQYLDLATTFWSQRQFFFGTLLKHDEVDEVTSEFARLKSYANSEDQDDFFSNCAALQAMLAHIKEMQWPYLQNIL